MDFGPPLLWIIFGVVVTAALAVDLGLKSHRERTSGVSMKEAATWSVVWIVLALSFAGVVYAFQGRDRTLEFLTGYLLEKALSVDNMFVFVVIFKFFAVPARQQPRVLKWGILGAILMRFVLIFVGVELIQKFHWLFYVFGALLIVTAVRLLFESSEDMDPNENFVLKIFRRFMPIKATTDSDHFFVVEHGRRMATSLFATLLVIEGSDLVFATDSIPAVLAVSTHPFIVFSSNIFAILGLRALYFLISGFMDMFRFLRVGLSVVLIFIGAKMLLVDIIHVPVVISLSVIVLILTTAVVLSIRFKEKKPA